MWQILFPSESPPDSPCESSSLDSNLRDTILNAATDRDDPSAQRVVSFACHAESVLQSELFHAIAERHPDVSQEEINVLLREAIQRALRSFFNPPQLPDSSEATIDFALATNELAPSETGPLVSSTFENREGAEPEIDIASFTEFLQDFPLYPASNELDLLEVQSPGYGSNLFEPGNGVN